MAPIYTSNMNSNKMSIEGNKQMISTVLDIIAHCQPPSRVTIDSHKQAIWLESQKILNDVEQVFHIPLTIGMVGDLAALWDMNDLIHGNGCYDCAMTDALLLKFYPSNACEHCYSYTQNYKRSLNPDYYPNNPSRLRTSNSHLSHLKILLLGNYTTILIT